MGRVSMVKSWDVMRRRLIGSWSAATPAGATISATYQPVSGDSALLEVFRTPSG